MLTTATGKGMIVMVVFAGIWLAFLLWQDWGQAGKTARARRSAEANGWEQDEMQNEITRKAALLGYRVMEVGLFVVMLVDVLLLGKDTLEFGILWVVCMIAERLYKSIALYRAAQGDEENPPSVNGLLRELVRDIVIPLVVFGSILRRFWCGA